MLTVILAIVTLLEALFSEGIAIFTFRFSVFLLVISFGVLLIRSVRKEVEQREELEVLTKELAAANTQLKKLDKAKSEFVSIASHQLRTPLTAIKGYMSMVLEGTYGKLDEKIRKPIENVYQSNERLINLINDLLSLSRIESGKVKLDLKPMDIEKIAKSVIDELDIKAKEKKLKLILEKSKQPLPKAQVDEEKIRNAILNVIDNAIRYTNKGSITFAATPMQSKLHLTISDTGEGMTKKELGELFESFTRGNAGHKNWTEGAGLGLYIARQFVQLHKGKIWAESEGEGKGSTFHIEIPVK